VADAAQAHGRGCVDHSVGRTADRPRAGDRGSGPIILFVDNGWTAAPDWKARQGLVEEAVRLAARQRRPIAIVTTADKPDTDFMDAGRAERAARALAPKPWLADHSDALEALAKVEFAARPEILWFADALTTATPARPPRRYRASAICDLLRPGMVRWR